MQPSRHPDEHESTRDQMFRELQAATAEVWSRVVDWRRSADWTDDESSQQRYAATEQAVTTVATLAQAGADDSAIADALGPILSTWRPSRPGPTQAIYAAVDRLRDAVRRATRDVPGAA